MSTYFVSVIHHIDLSLSTNAKTKSNLPKVISHPWYSTTPTPFLRYPSNRLQEPLSATIAIPTPNPFAFLQNPHMQFLQPPVVQIRHSSILPAIQGVEIVH